MKDGALAQRWRCGTARRRCHAAPMNKRTTCQSSALALGTSSASYFDAERPALLEAGARVLGNEECRKLADDIRSNQNMPPMNMPNVKDEPRP